MIIVYDVTNGDTFTNIKRWLYEIEQNCDSVSKILGMFVIDIDLFKWQNSTKKL